MLPGVGIFGTGPLAKVIATVLKDCGFTIAAVWSRALKDAEIFAKELDIPIYTNKVDGLLLKPEVGCVVILCTPHLQSPIAVKALGIGKHVIATWPAGTSQLEVLKMVKGATYYPSLLSIMCHGLRFLPAYIIMKQQILWGKIGDLQLFEVRIHRQKKAAKYSWRCDGLMGGGALSLHGSYIIDIITFLSDKKAHSVNGMVKTYAEGGGDVQGVREVTCDDFCTFQMELGSVSVSCTINTHVDSEHSHEVIAVGSKGKLVVKDLDLYIKLKEESDERLLHKETIDVDSNSKTSSSMTDALEVGRVPFTIG